MSRGRLMGYLVELDLVDPEDAPVTLYLSDLPMRPWPSTDADKPNQAYDPRVLEAPSMAIDLYADPARLTGSLGLSQLVLSNADGYFNQYRGWVFKAVRVWWGEIKPLGEARGFATDFRAMLDGRAETPAWRVSANQPSRLSVPIYDRRLDLENDVQPVEFAGTNAGPSDYEGGPDDLKDRPKPLALGDLQTANIPFPWVNPAAQVGQVHDGEYQALTGIFDRGQDASLTTDGDLSGAAFDAATPATGHYVTDLGRGLWKVDQGFGGVVTVGVQGAVDLVPGVGYLDTAPGLIEALIRREDPVASIGATFATIAAPETVGLYIADRTPTRLVIDSLARSMPGWVLPGPLGTWQIGKLRLPTGVADRTIEASDVLSIEPGDPSVSVPVWRVTVKGARLYQTHTRSNLAGALWDTADEARLRDEFRQAVIKDAALRDRWWPNVREVEIDTALRDPADLEPVAQLLFDVTSVRADGTPFEEWVIAVEMDAEWLDLLATPGLGVLKVRLIYPDEGIDRVMLAMGAAPGRPKGNQITLRVWG